MSTTDPPTVPDRAGFDAPDVDTADPRGAESVHADPGESPPAWRRRPLYGAFYGLVEPPFDLTPNPRFLFLSQRQREALSNLRYGLATSKGFTLILGEDRAARIAALPLWDPGGARMRA